jgi:uncharacterized protein (DUF849 family)
VTPIERANTESRPTALAVAPNGGRLTKADHPALPLTAAELAQTAAACLEQGAAMMHLHVRDRDGRHLLDADTYRDALAAVRGEVSDRLLVQITSESLGLYSPIEQMNVVRQVRPEAVSLALRELALSEADEAAFGQFIGWLLQENILPQIILYAPEEAARLSQLISTGTIPAQDLPVLHVLGRYSAGQTSAAADLLPFLRNEGPLLRDWMVCAFGRRETMCSTFGALLGGDVRVGFENNRQLPNGEIAEDNARLVEATRNALQGCGLQIASAAELRSRWVSTLNGDARKAA